MTHLLRMFIMSMLILYVALLTTPAWSADLPWYESVIINAAGPRYQAFDSTQRVLGNVADRAQPPRMRLAMRPQSTRATPVPVPHEPQHAS